MNIQAWKDLYNKITNNPVQVMKYFLFSLDHTDKGASIKKLLAWVVAACIVFLHFAWYKFCAAAAKPDFSLFTTILMFDGGLLSALIGINFLQERHLKNLDANDPSDKPPGQG